MPMAYGLALVQVTEMVVFAVTAPASSAVPAVDGNVSVAAPIVQALVIVI